MSRKNGIVIPHNLQVALVQAARLIRVMPLRYQEETLKTGQRRGPKSPKCSDYLTKATTDPQVIR